MTGETKRKRGRPTKFEEHIRSWPKGKSPGQVKEHMSKWAKANPVPGKEKTKPYRDPWSGIVKRRTEYIPPAKAKKARGATRRVRSNPFGYG